MPPGGFEEGSKAHMSPLSQSVCHLFLALQRLWREAVISVRNSLIIFSLCLVFMYFTGQRLPWEPAESPEQPAQELEIDEF